MSLPKAGKSPHPALLLLLLLEGIGSSSKCKDSSSGSVARCFFFDLEGLLLALDE
jgi:hypothetical protein